MPKQLVTFIHSKGRRIGCVIAVKLSDSTVGIGWSRCRKDDRWNREEAIGRAAERAETGDCIVRKNSAVLQNVAPSMETDVEAMANRSRSYFWPNHTKFEAPNGTVYGLTYRPRLKKVIAYAPDLTVAASLTHAGNPLVAVATDVTVSPRHRQQRLGKAMLRVLNRYFAAVNYSSQVLEDSDLDEED